MQNRQVYQLRRTFVSIVQAIMQNISTVKGILLFVLGLWCCSIQAGYAQSNPFDLVPRLGAVASADTVNAAATNNPFDIVPPATGSEAAAPPTSRSVEPEFELERKPVVTVDSRYRRLLLITTMASLLLLTILVTLFRGQLSRAYRAFISDNMLNQLQREFEGGGGFPYYLFYLLFIVTGGFYLFLLTHQLGYSMASTPFWSLMYGMGFVAAFSVAKHSILGFIGFVFPVRKETALYNLTIMVFNIVLGLILIVANLLLAYVTEELFQILAYGTLGAVAAVYLFLALRGLFLGSRFLAFHKFHFLLYICTIEIAPVVIIAKLIIS